MASNIPEARMKLQQVLKECQIDEDARTLIEESISMTHRESYKRKKAEPTSSPMTSQLRKDVADYYQRNPEEPTQSIANRFNVNAGRVSEVIRDLKKRGPRKRGRSRS